MDALENEIKRTLRQVGEFMEWEYPIPPWLQKKADGIELMQTDMERGVTMLMDGMYDERDRYDAILEGHDATP